MLLFCIITLLALMIIFYAGNRIGLLVSGHNSFVENLGRTLLDKKLDGLKNSAIFGSVRKSIHSSSVRAGLPIIFILILLKSIGLFFLSMLIYIAPILFLTQGFLMGSLVYNYHLRFKERKSLERVIFWQFLSHAMAASMGLYFGYRWLSLEEGVNWFLLTENLGLLLVFVTISTTIIASYLEVGNAIDNKQYLE